MTASPPTREFEPSGFTLKGVGSPRRDSEPIDPKPVPGSPQIRTRLVVVPMSSHTDEPAPTAQPAPAAQPVTTTSSNDDEPIDLSSIMRHNALARAFAFFESSSAMRTFAITALLASAVACAVIAVDLLDRDARHMAYHAVLRQRLKRPVIAPAASSPAPPDAVIARPTRQTVRRFVAPARPHPQRPFTSRPITVGTSPGLGAMPPERLPRLCNDR